MSLQQAEKPPPYSSDVKSTSLPSVPTTEPTTLQNANTAPMASSKSVPSQVSSSGLANPDRDGSRPGIILQPVNLPAAPHHEPRQASSPQDIEMSIGQNDQTRGVGEADEDANDRMAAEALCGLGKAEPSKSPVRSGYETPLQYYPIGIEHAQPGGQGQDTEPLLSLLTSSHPWLGGTINGSLSAYSSTKSFSPRFLRAGADLVENTVGSVGRRTGMEESIRRYLEPRRSSELQRIDPEMLRAEAQAGMKKLQACQDETSMDIEQGSPLSAMLYHSGRRTASGNLSVDSLPAYDKNTSPPYEGSQGLSQPASLSTMRPPVNRSWSKQLMISTSGLGAALSESSLRSLKFCLGTLNNANRYVAHLMDLLKRLLEDFRTSSSNRSEAGNGDDGANAMAFDSPEKQQPASTKVIAERIKHLNNEIWETLRQVVTTVSWYTGGALPENASVIVRWQLMSVPQRWQRATSRSSASSATAPRSSQEAGTGTADEEAVGSANRMLAFAIEGIDMMEQVSGVVDSTIRSAERWLDSFGRRGGRQDGVGNGGGEGMETEDAGEGLPSVEVEKGEKA